METSSPSLGLIASLSLASSHSPHIIAEFEIACLVSLQVPQMILVALKQYMFDKCWAQPYL